METIIHNVTNIISTTQMMKRDDGEKFFVTELVITSQDRHGEIKDNISFFSDNKPALKIN